MARSLVISAPASGAGKTTLTLAIARACCDRGLKVQCFKSGPDYIDPAFHTAATGRSSVNLDSWAMGREAIDMLVSRGTDADLILAEGSMGLFDGVAARGVSGTGATADIAEMMGWPVLLVLDPSGQAQTAAAVAAGLRDFRANVRIAGVILNRVGSPGMRISCAARWRASAFLCSVRCRVMRPLHCRSGTLAWSRRRSIRR